MKFDSTLFIGVFSIVLSLQGLIFSYFNKELNKMNSKISEIAERLKAVEVSLRWLQKNRYD